TSTIFSWSSAAVIRSARTSRIRALVCVVSVTMPACEPVSDSASWPTSLIAIAHSAQEIRSPLESSMSISRGSGVAETSSAIAISSSVVLPRADRTATTGWPASRFSTIRPAARLIRAASATEVPPHFITISPGIGRGLHSAAPGEGLAERDLVGVLQIRAHRQAAREPCDGDLPRASAQLLGDVQRGGLARGGRVRGEDDLPHGTARGGDAGEQLHHLQVLRIDAVDRREGPAEHVVDAVVLVRALHRDHVAGLLHDADQPVVAPRVLADAAARLVGEVEADLAQPDLLLDLPDRLGQRRGVLARGA